MRGTMAHNYNHNILTIKIRQTCTNMAKSMWTSEHILFVLYLFPEAWALICCHNSSHSSGKAYWDFFLPGCKDFPPFSHMNMSESSTNAGWNTSACSECVSSSQTCWMGLKSRTLSRLLKFFHTEKNSLRQLVRTKSVYALSLSNLGSYNLYISKFQQFISMRHSSG